MKTRSLVAAFWGSIFLMTVPALPGQSLGDLARQQREKQAKDSRKAAKVYTNENMPARPPDEGRTAAGGISTPPGAEVTDKSAPGATGKGGEGTAGEGKPPQATPATEAEKAEDKIKTRDYWQSRFKSARADLAKAEEEQQVVQDELQLLQIQQARELSPDVQGELKDKISAKNAELEAKKAVTSKAQKALEDLEKEFKDSSASEEWSKTE
jgi:hypothetical protein